jgi:Ca-activated chloride channel family protein
MFSFEHTELLIGLLVLIPMVLLFFSVLRWKKKTTRNLGDEGLINQLTKNYSAPRFNLKFILILAAIAALIISAANLRRPKPGAKENKAGIDVMIALDVSKSMWAEDTKPSRLDAAKQFVGSLIDQLNDNRVGLVLFAGRAFLQMPLTTDFSVAKLYVSNASPDIVPVQGTVVGDALRLCATSLNTKEKKYKAVVLISDGEDHDPHSTEVLQQLADNGVIVNTIGIGSAAGVPFKEPGAADYKTDAEGKTVITKLNETELMLIAQKTGGTYIHLGDAENTASQMASKLNSMEKKAIENSGSTRQYASFYWFFVLLALLMLITEIFIPEVKRNAA